MATYTSIPNTDIETDKPIRAVTGRALRDNPIAIAEGASGAPRVQTAGIENSAVTTAKIANGNVTNVKVGNGQLGSEKFQVGTDERDWVLARIASLTAGTVGTMAFARVNFLTPLLSAPVEFGETVDGSLLIPTNANSDDISPSLSGTWRCLGYADDANFAALSTLWVRVS